MSTILIIGNYDAFTKNLVKKLSIEKWRIYTLTNNKKFIKPSHVFEQYVFDYNSHSVKEIIKSCRPDVILFTGAYDSFYNWNGENVKDTALNFTANLSNVLISSAMQGIKHFIYLSSECVFEDEYIVDIKEEVPVSPKSYKGMAISQGENMALHFGQSTQMEITVLRLANMYGILETLADCNDVCSQMCVEAMIHGRLSVNAKRVFSPLFIRDAVEALCLLLKAPERRYPLYHISSMEEVTQDKVAKLIKDNCPHPVTVVDQTMGLKQRMILSNERFRNEFPLEIRKSYKDIIPKMIVAINNHKKRFLHSGETMVISTEKQLFRLLKNAIPFLECIILFIPVFMLNHRMNESRYLAGINFYLLYVLLFAIMYGRQQAVFASLLSVIGISISNIINTTDVATMTDSNMYVQIVQIFIVGLSVGYLKDKFLEMSTDMNDEVDFLKEQLKDITIINSSNERIKDYYTDKLISSKESIGRIYDITSKLQNSEMGEVLFAALDTLKEIMETSEVSIYLVTNKSYCRLTSASSAKSSSLGKSITIKDYPLIFNVLKKRQVYINRSLDSDIPMMASALFDDDENMRIVILLWSLPYERMTLYYANLLTIVGALVYSVFVRDANYLDALAYKRYLPDTTILQQTAFEEMINIYRRAGEKGYSESSILYIQKVTMSTKEVNKIIRPVLRETDYIGMMSDGSLAILLANTNKRESVHVIERLESLNVHTYLGSKF